MSLNRKPAGLVASASAGGLWFPDIAGLVAHYRFGTDFNTSMFNWATGQIEPAAAVIGTPTYGAAYADLNGNSASYKGFDLGYPITGDVLMIAAFTKPTTTLATASSLSGSTVTGLQYAAAGTPTFTNSSSGAQAVAPAANANWSSSNYLIAMGWGHDKDFGSIQTFTATGGAAVAGAISTKLANGNAQSATTGRAGGNLKIMRDGGGSGNARIASFGMIRLDGATRTRLPGADERLEIANRWIKQLVARGLTVTPA